MIPDELKRVKPLAGNERLGQNRESEYLGAEDIDVGTEPVLTIAALYNANVTLQRGRENKDVIVFAEESVPGIRKVRPLIVNATNRKTLRRLYGGVTADILNGKRVQLYIDHNVRDPSDGSKTDGIRIRQKVPAAPSKAPAIKCERCGQALTAAWGMEPPQLAEYTKKNSGAVLCAKCAKLAAEEQNAAKAAEEAPAEEPVNETDEG